MQCVARQVPALVALAGCDIAFGIPKVDPSPALCGPFGAPELVSFDSVLGSPTDFSVAADGVHGLVTANVAGVIGPTPIIYDDGTATWRVDAERDTAITLQLELTGGHMGEGGDVYGWIDHRKQTPTSIQHYKFTTLWGTVGEQIPTSNMFDLSTGQEIEIPDDAQPDAHSRFLVELKLLFSGDPPHSFDILAATFSNNVFTSSGFVDEFNNDGSLDVTGAALTAKHQILVYSAIVAPDTESHLYESEFVRNHFAVGAPMRSLLVPGHPDDQPWVNGDCSTIWFRRDHAVWMAHAQ